MFLMKKWNIFIIGALFIVKSYATFTIEAPDDENHWTFKGDRLQCVLSLGLPTYGVVYFEQKAAGKPYFILDKFQKVTDKRVVNIQILPPTWKPNESRMFSTQHFFNTDRYNLYIEAKLALRLLSGLLNGYVIGFDYQSEENIAIKIRLSPIAFRQTYQDYSKCVGQLLDYTYESVRHKFIHYSTEKSELDDKDKTMLTKIALYAVSDKQVKYVKVEGYTDDKGRKSYNNAISEYRAKKVKAFLLAKGVPETLLKVTWFGLKNPIYPNDTEEGRAMNRRVEVVIVK
jgi:outer membrane protein OmpA-like peptidoglycan-associated protein